LATSLIAALFPRHADKADLGVDIKGIAHKDGEIPGEVYVQLKILGQVLDLIFAQRAVIAIVGQTQRQCLFDPVEMQVDIINGVVRMASLFTSL